jgi:hypothetical protein
MDIKEIVKSYLEDNGYAGLWSPEGECACVNDDLFPCGEVFSECEAGYKAACDCGEHDWHIVANKPEPPTDSNKGD